jgi:flagella basal body P-ring formation protein FlgA
MIRGLIAIGLAGIWMAVAAAAPLPDADVMVVVLDHPVDAGDLLDASDLVEKMLAPGVAQGALRPRDIAGMEAARRLAAGSVVRSTDITRPQLVRRGEPVTITIGSGALIISTMGRALASGAAGASVRVVATSTNRTLDGVVDGPGAVRINANMR